MSSQTTRRFMQSMAQRAQVDWTKPYWTSSRGAAAYYNDLKSWVAVADKEAEQYSKPPPPIDFASAKKNIKDKGLVDMLESFYNSNKPAPEKYELTQEEKEHDELHLDFLREQTTFREEAIPVIEKEIEFWKSARTTATTTYAEMCANHPSLHEEIENEIEEREWTKDLTEETAAKDDDGH